MPGLKLKMKNSIKMMPIRGMRFLIGRADQCDCVIPSGHISREHLEIVKEGEAYSVQDLNSKMGTWLNGKPLTQRTFLRPGDVLKLANRIELEFTEDAMLQTETLAGQSKVEIGEITRLVAVSEPKLGEEFPVYLNITKIGRASDNHLHIPLETVSSRHAEISRDRDEFILTDLHSANGTFVNGTAITSTVLKHGDIILFDKAAYRFDAPRNDDIATQKMAELPQTLASPPMSSRQTGDFGDRSLLMVDRSWTQDRANAETLSRAKRSYGVWIAAAVVIVALGGLGYFLYRYFR